MIRFSKGDILFQGGEDSKEMYIIRSGRVRVFIEKDGSRIPLTELGKGHYVEEIFFLTGVKRSATVIALTPVVANIVSPDIHRR